MRIKQGFYKKLLINKVYLDQYYDSNFEIDSEDFRIIYSFLNSFDVNYEDDVILQIESSGDALIAAFIDFIAYYNTRKKIR